MYIQYYKLKSLLYAAIQIKKEAAFIFSLKAIYAEGV